jgi:predicted nuclease with TOPRIM domain
MYHPTFLITYQILGIARKNSRVAYSNLCLIAPYNITVGRGMGKNLRAEYEEVIVKHGLLTSFYSKEEKQSSDEELLKFYMKSETNRDRFWEEIETFRTKSSQLEALYHRERGRVLSGKLKRKLKEIRATGHFAVVDNVIVASAPTKKELDARVTEIMPEEKKEWVHRFKI